MNRTEHELELMRRYLEGVASLEETQELESLIVKDASLRQDFLRYTHLDSALAGVRRSQPSVVAPRRSVWLSWRPLTAAAAGIVIGLFSASVVWAYAIPRGKTDTHKTMPLLSESFEDASMVPERGFPSSAEGWSGDLSASISSDLEVKPKNGERMVRLTPSAKRKFSYATRIVDLAAYPLSASETRQVEVTASFCGANSSSTDRYQIRLAAFSEAPGEVKAIWSGDSMLDQVLQHVGRTVTMKPGDHGWHTLRATLEIPPGARSLVISLAAAVADEASAKSVHYLDDVHARFIITEAIP
jgi:hypothetical protein